MKFILLFTAVLFTQGYTQFEYTLEDYNENSPSFGADMWYPSQLGKITAHYFSTQG